MQELDADTHEHALASFEMEGAAQELLGFARKHDKELATQAEQRRVHDEMKHQFHAMMAEWKRFLKTFVPQCACAPAQPPTLAGENKASRIIER
jgi:hypothetical protein